LKHDLTKDGAWSKPGLDDPSPNDAKAVKAAEAEKIQQDGIKAKKAAGEPEKPKKKAGKGPAKAKEEAPKEAAFVGGMPDATF